MKKQISVVLTMLLALVGCNSTKTENYTPKTKLEKAFYNLKDNNFTIDFTDSFAINDFQSNNQKFFYTDYSIQSEGDYGFTGVAQGKDLIFKYNLKNNEIISGAPLIDLYYGTRYESIYDYTYGMNEFDFSKLPKKADENGWYEYEFGKCNHNDDIIIQLFLRMSSSSVSPESLKFKVTKDVITVESVVLSYDGMLEQDDTIRAVIYDVGKTQNEEIKQYLADGKTSKDPLDINFYKFINPYLSSYNYSIDMDSSKMISGYDYFKLTEYYTENAIWAKSNLSNAGYMLNQGVVTGFNIVNDKVSITSTAKNSDSQFYTSLYGGYIAYTFADLTYNDLVGYKDDILDNVYYLTDSYLIYVLSYLCHIEKTATNQIDTIKIEIIDEQTGEFKAYFNIYDSTTNQQKGTYEARFYDLNNTSITAVDKYLSIGDNPKTQLSQNLSNVLNRFKGHNYSIDVLTGAGLAKYYNTLNYFYLELYGDKNTNLGFIKINNSIYEFNVLYNADGTTNVNVNMSKDYAALDNPMTLPGYGSSFGANDDLGFVSAITDLLYSTTNYKKSTTIFGVDYWQISNASLSAVLFNYFLGSPTSILPMGSGVKFVDDGDNSKLTFIFTYVAEDYSFAGEQTFTFYDIGTTCHSIIDTYLQNI